MARLITALTAVLSLALVACSQDERAAAPPVGEARDAVAVMPGFVRPAPPGASSTAGYLTLTAASDDRLLAADAPGFGAVELHTVTAEGGVSRMRRVDGVPLPAGEAVPFEPGGYHLMMMAPEAPLAVGDTLDVTLTFERAGERVVTLPVQRSAEG